MHKICLSIIALSISLSVRAQSANKDSIALFNSKGYEYYQKKDYSNAAKYWEKSLPLVEKYGKDYEKLLNALAMLYIDTNDLPNQERIMALAEEHNQHELQKECNEPQCMLERAQYYSTKGNTVKAKETFTTLLAMKMDKATKANAYDAYAKFLTNIKDWVTAADYEAESARLCKELFQKSKDADKDGSVYAERTYLSALYYQIGKQHQKASELLKVALTYYLSHPSEKTAKRIPACHKELGNAYCAMKDYAHAIESYKDLIAYYEQHDTTTQEYPKAILRLAKAEKFNKDYDLSITHHKQAMEMFQQRNMTEAYADAANSLKLCYIYAGKTEEVDSQNEATLKAQREKLDRIIQEEKDNLDMTKQYLGELPYAQSLATIAGCYAMKEDFPNAITYYKMYMPTIRQAIQDEFRMQGERDRMLTWQEEYKRIEEMLELLTIIPSTQANLLSDMAAIAYDAELLSKGILLNSSIEFEKVLAEKGDQELIKNYHQTLLNEKKIQNLRMNLKTESDLEKILQLTQQNQSLIMSLYKSSAEFADFTNYISYNWQDVQKKMASSDIAIEFASIDTNVFDEDNDIIALVLTADMKAPIAVKICSKKEAKDMIADDNIYESSQCCVWEKLKSYLSGKKRLFFSADGYFNRIALEYLPFQGKNLSEQMEVYRLSTTKELCYEKKPSDNKEAVLFGDIDYNGNASMSTETKRSMEKMRGSGSMETFSNLANTRKEIDGIKSILSRSKKVHEFSDTEANKQTFLQLSGSKVNILHIATHGAYNEKKGMSDAESMSSSILAFAGANLDTLGIVSAAEVARMNLRKCDLVVLSACETALGKLGTDGVFGLQRGFKNAGVHTILMSLKNVYDTSTAELMIAFYKNLMKGANKREALKKAQEELKAKGYKDAKYWAPFILLDAMK